MIDIDSILDISTAFTAYSVDALNSNMYGLMDEFISHQTNSYIFARYWATHDDHSIQEFYCNSKMPEIQKSLVKKLFIKTPTLITIWKGPDIYNRLSLAKGKSNPILANPGSIRGTLFCDNSICNLIHTPDSLEEAKREVVCLVDVSPVKFVVSEKKSSSGIVISHSGIVMLHKMLSRLLFDFSTTSIEYRPSLLNRKSVGFYKDIRNKVMLFKEKENVYVSRMIDAYFSGDFDQIQFELEKHVLPLTQWEKFVLLCGSTCVKHWES